MAHDVVGLDLGSSEVRAVVVRMALRGSEVVRVMSEPVPLGEDGRSVAADVLQAAGRLFERLEVSHETVHCALAGELASVRQIALPASAAKRLEQVLKFELDEVLPYDIEDAVFGFVNNGRVGDELSVTTGTALTEQVRRLVNGLDENGIAPREIGIANLSYVTGLSRRLAEWDEVRAVVDIGHQRTNIAVLDGKSPTVRTVLRGSRDLTAQLAQVGGVDFDKAEAFKRQHGLSGKVGEVLVKALKPLIREIQQTLKGHMASGGERVGRVLLCGGGGLLKGLREFLADEIGVPVEHFTPPIDTIAGAEDQNADASTFALSYSLAVREEVQRAKRIDLRRGDLAFKGDFEFLKRRIGWMAVCALAILLSWIFASYAEYTVLVDEVDKQKATLAQKTKSLLGKEIFSYKEIDEKLGGEKVEEAPFPKKDVFDILVELSKRIPVSVVHDVELLEIKSKRITIRGVVDAELKIPGDPSGDGGVNKGDAGPELSPTDLIKQKLEEFTECFSAIRVTKVTAVGERRRYQMDIETRCP
ncbi:MAG: pilus assembly protein PilM [Deltaproteobacteria bacterium]|nr:pilus assembly protein PilM [Deltaproteobacteria bacterium]